MEGFLCVLWISSKETAMLRIHGNLNYRDNTMKSYGIPILILVTLLVVETTLPALQSRKTTAPLNDDEVLRHVVFFDFNEQAADSIPEEVGRIMSNLPETIDSIQDLEWGANINKGGEYTHCLLLTFKSVEGLEKYNDHPDHKEVARQYGKYVEKVAEVDYWH